LSGLLLLALAGPAFGHADPRGDLHPQVLVKDGNFAIVFNSSQPEGVESFTGEKAVFRMIYTPEGKLVAPRHPLDRKRDWRETGPAGLYGKGMRLGDVSVYFGGGHSSQPGFRLRTPDGVVTRVTLPWSRDLSLNLCEDVMLLPEGLALTGKEGRGEVAENNLKFYWFEHEATEALTTQSIGPTICIYDFPVASNIAYAGGRFWVAYMRPAGQPEDEGVELALWSWKPGEEKGRVEVLDSPAHWNCHLSMAAIGDRLCLAYHCAMKESYYGTDARIVTVFRKAE
jgi:hypothetical protein